MSPVRYVNRLPLLIQLAIILIPLLLTGAVMVRLNLQNVQEREALAEARAVAALSESLSSWSSQFGGVWLRSDSAEGAQRVGNFLERKALVKADGGDPMLQPSVGAYHSKTPDWVVKEVTKMAEGQSGLSATVRLTNEKVFSSKNKPTPFEQSAIQKMKSAPGLVELYEVSSGSVTYVRRLTSDASCQSCHESASRGPAVIKAKYFGTDGWGYRLNDFGGVLSVTVPMKGWTHALDAKAFAMPLAAFCVCTVMFVFWLLRLVWSAGELQRLGQQAIGIGPRAGKRSQLDADEVTSRNEIHGAMASMKALKRALSLAQKHRIAQSN